MSENTGELIADIINRIEAGIKKEEKYNLQLIDQVTLANAGINIFTLCQENGWFPFHDDENTSVKINKIPDGFEYEENPNPGMAPKLVPTFA